MSSTPERYRSVEMLYLAAIERPPDERAAFLEQACTDEEIRREVESLLSFEHKDDTLMQHSPWAQPPGVAADPGQHGAEIMDPATTAMIVIGRYHLQQIIGEGGMGEVWLAEQKEPVRRRVALKLVRAGLNSREVIARFESERQALALMDHPAIAKVLDAGSTEEGAPYFVMEYVAGVPITTYCDHHRLSTRERLELFARVCEGVQHAHQKAIIHRDLKPSNILVTEVDGRPAPKIIDFGVAKALSQKLIADTLFTRLGALVGTPEYMSPEQALSSGEDIDTRTDIYSLGVLFYELLAGQPPIDLRKIAFDEFLRRLREEDPPKPSTKVSTQDAILSTELARNRQTEPQALVKQMRGDLDSIALKALEKDRSRRYGSASDFALDIRRYLNNEAVLAVPPSAAYRARKFVRRYRAALATATAFALVLIVAGGVSLRESIRANREAAVAQAVNDFLQNDVLAQASANNQAGPASRPDPDLKVRTALDRAAARIAGKFDRQPEVEAEIRDTIGQTYTDLGSYPEALEQLQRALDLHREALGAENPKTLRTISHLGRVLSLEGKYPQAEALLHQALEAQRRLLGPENRDTLSSLINLGNVHYAEGDYAHAGALISQSVDICRRVLGPDNVTTVSAMNMLANVYYVERHLAKSEALYLQVLEIRRRVLGPEHPDTLVVMGDLANLYKDEGKYAQAEALQSEVLDIRRRVLGAEHPRTLLAMRSLANIYYREGKYARAEALARTTVEISRRVLGPEHISTLVSMQYLGDVYCQEGKYKEAADVYIPALAIMRRVIGPEHPTTLITLSDLASMYQREGKYTLAETYALQELAGFRHSRGLEHPETMEAQDDLALAYLSQGKFAESERLAREAVEFNRRAPADQWWERFRAPALLGASLAAQKKYAEAEPLLLEAYRGLEESKDTMPVPDRDEIGRVVGWIVVLYHGWGKPEKSAEWRHKLQPSSSL